MCKWVVVVVVVVVRVLGVAGDGRVVRVGFIGVAPGGGGPVLGTWGPKILLGGEMDVS